MQTISFYFNNTEGKYVTSNKQMEAHHETVKQTIFFHFSNDEVNKNATSWYRNMPKQAYLIKL